MGETGATESELRAAPRFSLLIRAAKLIGANGEYLCVVRDVSATGTRLRLLHEAPAEVRPFLELANGDRFAMEQVWAQGGHAGYRFATPIDIDSFIHEPSSHVRRPLRLRIERPAQVFASGMAALARLHDISQQGACIETGILLAIEELLRLEVDGLPPRVAKVRWRSGQVYGLVFEQTFRLDELARHAFALVSRPLADLPDEACGVGGAGRCT